MDNKSVQDAISIIGQNRDKVTMLVKKEDGGTVSLPADRFRSPEREKKEEPREGILSCVCEVGDTLLKSLSLF